MVSVLGPTRGVSIAKYQVVLMDITPKKFLAGYLREASNYLLEHYDDAEGEAAKLLQKASRVNEMSLRQIASETEALGDFYASKYEGKFGRLAEYGFEIERSIRLYNASRLMLGKIHLDTDTPLELGAKELRKEINHPDFIRINIKLADSYFAKCDFIIARHCGQEAIDTFESLGNSVDCSEYTDDISRMRRIL